MKKSENRLKAGLSSHLSAAKWLTAALSAAGVGQTFAMRSQTPCHHRQWMHFPLVRDRKSVV